MPLDVTVLEVPARFGALDEQVHWVDTALTTKAPGQLVVLPETALTGYVSPDGQFDLTRFAEPLEGRQLTALRGLARRWSTTIIGPVIELDGSHRYNTQVVVAPDGGLLARYRKRHPWFPETWATPGDEPLPRFWVGGLCCTLAICFDVHFLADESAAELEASDVLFFCSAWVDDEGDSRPGHLTPLAHRFGLTIVNANWGPGEPRVHGQGGSIVVGPEGVRARLTWGHRLDVRVD